MKLEKELGSYSRWITKEYISFRTNGTSAPDRIRDGKSQLCLSVTRVSAGLFTIALRTNRPSIKLPITAHATLSEVNVPPTQAARCSYVEGSWNQAAGTFQVQVVDCGNTTPAAVDPDSGCRICVQITGAISSVGTDAA